MDSIIKTVLAGFVVFWMPAFCEAQMSYSAMRQYPVPPQTPQQGVDGMGYSRTLPGQPVGQPPMPPRYGLFRGRAAFYADEQQFNGPPRGGMPGQQGIARTGYSSDPPWTQHLIKNENRSYDFGNVAKGTPIEHHFILENAFQEEVHIANVSSSCTCTTVHVLDNRTKLQTYEKTAVVAQFRADLYDGPKSATITVVIDRPHYAEFHLNVRGDIRSDITIKPGTIRFDSVQEGEDISRTIDVVYSGRYPAWKIVDFKSSNDHLSGEIVDVQSVPGLSTTKIRVKLDKDTPVGSLMERLYLVTNDQTGRREIPILVRATIGTTIGITPETLFFGYLSPGETSSKIIVLQGSKPFRIKDVNCDNPAIETSYKPKEDAPPKIKHIIPLRYLNPVEGPGAPVNGRMQAVVKIETDLPNVTPTLTVLMVLAKEEPKEKEEQNKENIAESANKGN